MTPVGGDDEEQAGESERCSGNDRPRTTQSKPWHFSCDEPDTGEEDEQEANLGEAYTGVMCDSQHEVHVHHSLVLPRRCPRRGRCRGMFGEEPWPRMPVG